MIIKVEQADIDIGVQENTDTCAAARGIQRQVPGCSGVSVDYDRIEIGYAEGGSVSVPTPKSVTDFIKIFDDDKDLAKPFEFELPISQENA